jgi:CRISPR-associated protein Cas2
MSNTASWYLIAYDIRDRRRLRRLHRTLSGEGLALQYSVFLVSLNPAQKRQLLSEVERIIDASEDDLRLYPIDQPEAIESAFPLASDALLLGGGGISLPQRQHHSRTRR